MTITPKHPHRKRIHLTRHAQAEHNVASDWTSRLSHLWGSHDLHPRSHFRVERACLRVLPRLLETVVPPTPEVDRDGSRLTTVPDARLTPLGQKQSRELHDLTKDSVQQTAELLVSSPVRSMFVPSPITTHGR